MAAWKSCVTWRRSARAGAPARVVPVALRLRGPREDSGLACGAASATRISRARCKRTSRRR
jgi:hypothetical protein